MCIVGSNPTASTLFLKIRYIKLKFILNLKMIVGGILISIAFLTYLIFNKPEINKYSLKYYKLKWGSHQFL